MIAVIFLVVGLALGVIVEFHIPLAYSHYISVGIVAALDTVFGGFTAILERRFRTSVFVTGFFANTVIAVVLTLIGKLLDVDLYLAAVIVFGTRIFQNLSKIRHKLMEH